MRRRMHKANRDSTFPVVQGDVMSERILTKQRSQGRVQDRSQTTVSAEIDKVVIASVAAFTGIVGLWVVASLGVALYQAGGPFQLVGAWFKAVTGL
jgi:hypothetical protein